MAWPATSRPANTVPAALTPNVCVSGFSLVVLTDLTAVADTRPASTLAPWTVLDAEEANPLEVVWEAALVSMVPLPSTGGTLTDAAVFVCVTPVCAVQPRVDSAERPDFTVLPTFTC